MSPRHVEIARRYVIEVLEEGNIDVLRRLVDTKFVRRDPMGEVSGIAAVERQLLGVPDVFSNIFILIDDIVATDDQIVVRYAWHATHHGELFGIPATEKRIALAMVEVLQLRGNTIVEADVYYDRYALFEQLGVVPAQQGLAPRPRPVLRLVPMS